MLVPVILAVGVVAVSVFARWAYRRWNEVDSFHEREHQDPPVFDAGDWLGGGRI